MNVKPLSISEINKVAGGHACRSTRRGLELTGVEIWLNAKDPFIKCYYGDNDDGLMVYQVERGYNWDSSNWRYNSGTSLYDIYDCTAKNLTACKFLIRSTGK